MAKEVFVRASKEGYTTDEAKINLDEVRQVTLKLYPTTSLRGILNNIIAFFKASPEERLRMLLPKPVEDIVVKIFDFFAIDMPDPRDPSKKIKAVFITPGGFLNIFRGIGRKAATEAAEELVKLSGKELVERIAKNPKLFFRWFRRMPLSQKEKILKALSETKAGKAIATQIMKLFGKELVEEGLKKSPLKTIIKSITWLLGAAGFGLWAVKSIADFGKSKTDLVSDTVGSKVWGLWERVDAGLMSSDPNVIKDILDDIRDAKRFVERQKEKISNYLLSNKIKPMSSELLGFICNYLIINYLQFVGSK